MSITNKDYLKRIAEISIGVSTLRGHPKGTISIARRYLKTLDLAKFRSSNEIVFRQVLDKHTTILSKEIRKSDKNFSYWGSARKALNIFLGNATYHAILRKEYRLDLMERYLEVPLDSQVAKELFFEAQKRNVDLPRWTTIKGLFPEASKSYQSFASLYARELGCTRIQLDVLLWRKDKYKE